LSLLKIRIIRLESNLIRDQKKLLSLFVDARFAGGKKADISGQKRTGTGIFEFLGPKQIKKNTPEANSFRGVFFKNERIYNFLTFSKVPGSSA